MSWILTEHKGPIFEITFNRPDKRNAIQLKMLRRVAEAINEAEQQPDVRLVVIRGAGKAFSAGLDLQSMGGVNEDFGPDWLQRPHALTREWQRALNRLTESPLPIVALLHGYCLGAGLETALACDFRYAAADVTLSLEETRLGLIPDVGGTTRLAQLIGMSRAKELIFTGRRIDAERAERWGLVNRVVATQEELSGAAEELATELAGCAPLAVAAAKRIMQGIADEETGLALEQIEQAPLFHTEDLQEGIQAAIERRPPQWKRL